MLTSDDGAILYLDDKEVINNDGQHAAQDKNGIAKLVKGVHSIRVSYFKDRGFRSPWYCAWRDPGEPLRIFSTDEFRPPANLELPPR